MATVGLGIRAALSRPARRRFLLLTVVGVVTCGCFLIVLTAPAVKTRERNRYVGFVPQGGSLRTEFGPRATDALYRGRRVILVLLPSGLKEARLPPGLGSPLVSGQMRLSPALADRVKHDPVLASWFPYKKLADLPINAVASAGEYKAYIAVPPEYLLSAIGSTDEFEQVYNPHFGYYQLLGFLLFAGVPALGLVAISSRFGRRIRRERYAALRLLGMQNLRCRAVLGIETGLPIALGATVVAALAARVRPHHVVVPIVDRWVFGQDAQLGPGPLLATVATVAVLGVALGATTPQQRSATGRLRALVARAEVTRSWIVGLYAAGLALIVWAWLRPAPDDPRRFVGVLLVGAGIPSAVAYGAKVTAAALRWQDGPLSWFLGMRKLWSDPRSLSRLGGIVGVVIFVIGVAQPIAQVVAQPNSTWVARAHSGGATTVFGRLRRSIGRPPIVLKLPPPAGTLVAVTEVQLGPAGRAVIASCTDFATLIAADVPMCHNTIQQLQYTNADGTIASEPQIAHDLHDIDGKVIARIPAPTSTVTLRRPPELFESPGLLIPPNDPVLQTGARPYVTQVYVRTVADADAWEAARAWLIAASPAYWLENEFDNAGAVGDSTGNWIVLGFAFAGTIAIVGAALSSLDDQSSTQEWAALRALGVSTISLVVVRMVISTATAIVSVIVATLPAMLLTDAYLKVNNEHLESYTAFVVAAIVGALAVLTITLASATAQMRKLARTGGEP